MDDAHKPYLERARKLQFRFEDVVDDENNPQAQQLKHELHGLVDDMVMNKDPRHTENRLKVLERALEQAKDQGEQVMSFQDIDSLRSEIRDLREDVRSMPNY